MGLHLGRPIWFDGYFRHTTSIVSLDHDSHIIHSSCHNREVSFNVLCGSERPDCRLWLVETCSFAGSPDLTLLVWRYGGECFHLHTKQERIEGPHHGSLRRLRSLDKA